MNDKPEKYHSSIHSYVRTSIQNVRFIDLVSLFLIFMDKAVPFSRNASDHAQIIIRSTHTQERKEIRKEEKERKREEKKTHENMCITFDKQAKGACTVLQLLVL